MNAIPKTISYRIYSFIIMCGITFYITGSVRAMIGTSLGIEVIKLVQYYIFEKYHNKIYENIINFKFGSQNR
jgi:uncharacterized membrane protein